MPSTKEFTFTATGDPRAPTVPPVHAGAGRARTRTSAGPTRAGNPSRRGKNRRKTGPKARSVLRIRASSVDDPARRVNPLTDMKGFPRRFGPYALAKPLARGGMGALYLAVHPDRAPAVCVIKTVLPHLADKEYLQRFRDAAKEVVQLSHRSLVPVFDSGEDAGENCLGMEFVDGRDLRAAVPA